MIPVTVPALTLSHCSSDSRCDNRRIHENANEPKHDKRSQTDTRNRGWEMTDRTDKKDLATEGTADRLKGAAKQAEGRIRNAVGGLTGDTGEQVKGKAQEIKGKVQDAAGKAKQRSDPNPGVDDA